jgi:hypothetical protein
VTGAVVQSPGPHLGTDPPQGLLADRGQERAELPPVLVPRRSLPELVPQERKRRVLVRAAPLPVLTVDDPGLVRMQPQADLLHPYADRGQHLTCLLLADTMHDRVVDIALERDGRKLPSHPRIERIVQEQIREHRRDRRSLRSTAIPRRQRRVGLLQRRV